MKNESLEWKVVLLPFLMMELNLHALMKEKLMDDAEAKFAVRRRRAKSSGG